MAKRAKRRADRERMKLRNMRNYPHWERAFWFGDTRVRCSRACCGNPRKWNKERTVPERRFLQSAADEIDHRVFFKK